MRTILEKLWYDHLSTEAASLTEDEEKIIPKLLEADEALRKELSKEQAELLDLCNDYHGEMASLNIRQAFICGVKFTAGFLLEALEK